MAIQDLFFSGWSELIRTVVVGTLAYIAVVLLIIGTAGADWLPMPRRERPVLPHP